MTIKEEKIRAIKKLRRASGLEAPIDAEILLAHALKISREEMLAHDERVVPSFALHKFNSLITRRAKHEPVAYLVKHKEFFGLQFAVNKHVLIPRPETELIVEEALNKLQTTGCRLAVDVGTGSGAIAIAIAKNAPNVTVIATDISKQAIKLAERNAIMNNVDDRIVFRRDNLVSQVIRPLHLRNGAIITANLPYLPTRIWQKAPPDVKKFEPRSALDGGKDGLKYYDELFHQIVEHNLKTIMICEIDPSQKRSFPRLAARHFPNAKIEIKNDLAGRPRVVVVTLPTTK
jgi:release factor glutamine methyltransferase